MKTILLVDDELYLLQVFAFALELQGYRVLTAENKTQALKHIHEYKVDIIVTDYRMPGENGIELIQEVKRIKSTPPVFILMTGISSISVQEAYEAGFKKILTKPFTLAELGETIREHLAESSN